MTLALYRKYRPQKIEDLISQDSVAQILQNAAKANRIGHAYLFYGPRGTGKTTTARLIAKLLNCEKRQSNSEFQKEGEPCNECSICREINSGSSLDIIEIDAASNRGIDEIRNLKETIRQAPSKGKFKVYIIDEVHMLTGPAFNALLKILEEPPKHAVLILATTEYEKIPPTIASRAQRFLFKKAPKAKILQKLKKIAEVEKIAINSDALELIAASGEGSFRDAESLLDQVASSNEPVTLEYVENLTGRTGLKKIHKLASLIIEKKLEESVEYLAKIYEEGHNPSELTKDLIHYLRKILSLKTNPNLEKAFKNDLTPNEIDTLKSLTSQTETGRLVEILKSLITAYSEIRYSPLAIVPLEVALIENLNKSKSEHSKSS